MSNIKQSLNKLNINDTFTLVLFALYELKDIPEYSVLSELVYLIEDKKSLFNLLTYFGGMTLKIPTINELDTVVDALQVFHKIMYDNVDVDKAIDELHITNNKKEVIEAYKAICSVLAKYDFKR